MSAIAFGKAVKKARRERGECQATFAARIGISRTYLSEIERGIAENPSYEIKQSMCLELGLIPEEVKQEAVMRFSPADGEPRPFPSHARQFRQWKDDRAWLFNPWTGDRRDAADVAADLYGHEIDNE